MPVWMLNCTSPSEHGVAQYCVPAALYIAQDEWVTKGKLLNFVIVCFACVATVMHPYSLVLYFLISLLVLYVEARGQK